MRKLAFTLCLSVATFLSAQNVYLNKVHKTHDNTDKFLYKIDEEISLAEHLGEVEVQGFSNNDVEIFSKIYKKAKEIGANAIALKPQESIDGKILEFDPNNYKLNLYYIEKNKFKAQDSKLYLFASSQKNQKISINSKDHILIPRSYVMVKMVAGEIYTISTKKLLGSTIKIKSDNINSNQYYQISALKLGGNNQNDGTLHLKSGDITGLERSYAEYLSLIYNEQK